MHNIKQYPKGDTCTGKVRDPLPQIYMTHVQFRFLNLGLCQSPPSQTCLVQKRVEGKPRDYLSVSQRSPSTLESFCIESPLPHTSAISREMGASWDGTT